MSDINIDQLANLARLDVSSQEREKITKGVSDVLEYVKKIQTIEIVDMENVDEDFNKLRQDVVCLTSPQDLIDAFSERQENLLKAPAISGKEKTYEA